MKKHITLFALFIALVTSTPGLKAQDYLVDYTFLGTRTKAYLYILFGSPVDYDVNLYKIRYKTPDIHGAPDTASGLLVLPVVPASAQLPLVVYEHGTTDGPNDVPSKLHGGYEVAMAYAGKGFATVAPDFLGLGDARGFHPYVHAASEASASFDMLNASVEYLEHNDPDWDQVHLFLCGYSQGGHASAALHKELQDNWSIIYPVTAATHMSGPYSISGVMRNKLLSNTSYGYPAYLAYIVMGYQEAYGNLYADIHDFFKEPFVTNIQNFKNGLVTLTTLNAQLIAQLAVSGDTITKRMIQDSILEKIVNDASYPLNLDLKDNDRYNWAPDAPTRLFYCGGDLQVPFQNAIIADSAMNALGAPDAHAVSMGATLDHGPCVLPSIVSSIVFFQSFLNPSAVLDFEKNPKTIEVMPNPAVDYLTINWEQATDGVDYQIINLNGQTIAKGSSPSNSIDVRALPGGMYMILVSTGNQTRIARFIHP
jgi:hypothetical protein